MNENQQTVATSFVIVGLSVYLGAIATGNRPTSRPIAGIAVAGAILLAAANGTRTGPIARQFSVLVAVTAVLTSGFYVAAAAGRYFGGTFQPQPNPSGGNPNVR